MTATARATLDVAYDHWDSRRRAQERGKAIASLEQFLNYDAHEHRFDRSGAQRLLGAAAR